VCACFTNSQAEFTLCCARKVDDAVYGFVVSHAQLVKDSHAQYNV
jgi:hypothetical protein